MAYSIHNFQIKILSVHHLDNWVKFKTGNGKVLSKDCESLINEPLLLGEDERLVEDCFTFRSLHGTLGLTNKLVQELEKVWKEFHLWPESLHIVREDYFGKQYEVKN